MEKGALYDTASINKALQRGAMIRTSNPDSSYRYFNQALKGSYAINYDHGVVSSFTEIGKWYYNRNLSLAIRNARKALEEYQLRKLSDNTLKNQAYLLLAKSYDASAVLDSAAYYYYHINEEIEKGNIKDPGLEIQLYSTLAVFWLNNSSYVDVEYAQPVKYFISKAQQALTRLPAKPGTYAELYRLQALYYCSIANFDSARYFFNKNLQLLANNPGYSPNLPIILLNLSNSYIMEKRPAEAKFYIDSVMRLNHAHLLEERLQITANLQLAMVYYQQKKYANCISVLDDTWRRFDMNFLNKDVIDAYKIYGDSYEALGLTDKAIACKNKYIELYDSFATRDKLNMMSKIESRYRLSEKDKKLAEQNLQISKAENNARQKSLWVIAISLLAIVGFIISALWLRANRHKQRLLAYRFEKQMEISRLTYTIAGEEKERNRIARELHDGIGGLLAAAKINLDLVKKEYHFNNESNFIEVMQLVDQAASDLRKTAHNMMPEILMQDGLVKALEQFCNSIASKNTTHIYFEVIGTNIKLKSELELSLYRIVQELVHNIIKHSRATEAFIQISFSEDELNISVEDNGIGISSENKKGLGIKSIQDRVKALNGNISIESGYARGTNIYINIALQKENIETI
ncbi:sensor histidine kinase [Filimonas effusa]|uniref:sensor histidine kinase n=1 Tax=Filimonas effusa TaxID=2508721 RepID=UPI0013E92075|nr:sensor histidine kinase [Filimonas effusa]